MLPTRNGASLLDGCVRSVLEQDAGADELELVVSDNASDDGTADVLAAFAGDPRLRVLRQPEPLSVTDNWSAALEACRGERILMIGDDDVLLPGAVRRIFALLDEWSEPDVLAYEAYGFAFPGALAPDAPARASERLFPYANDFPVGVLDPGFRRGLVRDFFRFEFTFCPNLQTTVLSRRALARLRAGVFREPYPDFYALYALLLQPISWVHVPDRLVVVGISPKSFGRTLQREGSAEGRSYLGIETEVAGGLPGSDMINGMHRTLGNLAEDFAPELGDIRLSRSNYVYRQMYSWYLAFRMGWIDRRELTRRLRLLSVRDAAGFSRELLSRIDLDMVRRHARPDDDAAIGSVWAGMERLPRDDMTIAEFAADRPLPQGT